MELSAQILSDITVYMKYARYLPEENRRETWDEIVDRNMNMHIKKFPQLEVLIKAAYVHVRNKKVLPSMRSMQFGGRPIEVNPTRLFNCSLVPMEHTSSFSETMFLLLSGCGVGYSVQKHHVEKLPEIKPPNPKRARRFLIADSIEGWADSIKALLRSYFEGTSRLRFDFSDIRPKGSLLVTSGGKAPGPQPLRECLVKVEGVLREKEQGDKLEPIEVHDIVCHMADAVLAGGIRRAATISFFSADDEEMISCKYGDWWTSNPQRARANNSAVLLRHRVTKEFFDDLWGKIKASNSGEPGIFFTNDKDCLSNPCVEAKLRPNTFCNLSEINASAIKCQEDLEELSRAAAFIGTLQASYTDFHYLRDVWKRNTEKDALLGVSITGLASLHKMDLDYEKAAKIILEENKKIADVIGIKTAARTSLVKPSGTASIVLGTASGIHSWHSKYYLRRVRVGKNEAIYKYLNYWHPELLEDDYMRPHDTSVITVPIKAPNNALTRDESALHLLERLKKVSKNWIRPGHRRGPDTHNVSCTVSIRDHEWHEVGEWMWKNQKDYNGLAVLPYSGHTYKQAPFEECSQETYEYLLQFLKQVDLKQIREDQDDTDLQGELACAGGVCTVTNL